MSAVFPVSASGACNDPGHRLVVDVDARISVIVIEVITIDARIVIASVDTCLRFAEAVNRLDLDAQKERLFGSEKKEAREKKATVPGRGSGAARAGGPAGLIRQGQKGRDHPG